MTEGWAGGERGEAVISGCLAGTRNCFGLCKGHARLGLGQPGEEEESGGVGWL